MWSLVPEVSVAAASQRGSCTPIVRCAWPKGLHLSRTVNGGTSGAFMHAGVRTSGTFRPFLAPRPFPLWADCPEKWPLPLNLTLPLPVGWGFCIGFLEETKVVKAGAGSLGGGRVRALWSWLSLAKVSNKRALDSKETSPCSLSPAWDTSTPATHQSRSERTARIFENRRLELAELHPVKLTLSGEILPWSETNMCHSGGSWPTLNKEGAFESLKSSALEDGSLG